MEALQNADMLITGIKVK